MIPRHARFRTSIVVLTGALALVAPGCGDDGNIEASDDKAPATTAAADTGDDTAETVTTERVTPSMVTAPEIVHPCELVPLEEATQVLPGATLLEGIEAGQGDDLMCTYAGDPNGSTAQVEVYVGDGAKKSFDIDRDVLAHEFEEVPGIGDEAHYEDGNIFFRVGERWVQFRTVTLEVSPETVKANLIALATAVVTRL